MRILTFFLLVTISFFTDTNKYIAEIRSSKSIIKLIFQDSTTDQFEIFDFPKKHFHLDSATPIYIDVDHIAIPKENMDSLLNRNTIRPKDYYDGGVPAMYLVFIVDSSGHVMYKGFDRETIDVKSYQQMFYEQMVSLNINFTPASLNGKNVASLLRMCFTYDRGKNHFEQIWPR